MVATGSSLHSDCTLFDVPTIGTWYIYFQGVAVVSAYCLDMFVRCIPTFEFTTIDSRQNLPWRQQTRSCFPGWFPYVRRDFSLVTGWGWPSRFWPLDTPGTSSENNFRSADSAVGDNCESYENPSYWSGRPFCDRLVAPSGVFQDDGPEAEYSRRDLSRDLSRITPTTI